VIKLYSHPRSGTNWVRKTLAEAFWPDADLERPGSQTGHWSDRVQIPAAPALALKGGHDFYAGQQKCIYLVRDGRDVALSYYRTKEFQHEDWRDLSFSEVLRKPLDWRSTPGQRWESGDATIVEHWFQHVKGWEGHKDIYYLRYEDLLTKPGETLHDLGEWLGREPRAMPDPEPTGPFPSSDHRPAKWRDEFSADDLDYFHSIVPEDFWALWSEDGNVQPAPKAYNGICVGTPRASEPTSRYWRGIMSLLAWAAHKRVNFSFEDVCDKNSVSENHNELIEHFLDTDREWLLMMDSDAIIPAMALERMLAWDKKIVVPMMFRKIPPYAPTIYKDMLGPIEEDRGHNDFNWIKAWCMAHVEQLGIMDKPIMLNEVQANPLVSIKRCGTHVMLCHRDVFEAIKPPWFEPKKASGSGSDFVFTRKAIEAGFEVFVDLSIFSGHIQGGYCTGVLDWLVWSDHTHYSPEHEGMEIKVRRTGVGEDVDDEAI